MSSVIYGSVLQVLDNDTALSPPIIISNRAVRPKPVFCYRYELYQDQIIATIVLAA